MSKEQNVCELCGVECSAEELEYFNNQLLCGDCLDEHTLVCTCCGTRIWAAYNCGDSDHLLCESCYDNEYTQCESCGRLIRRDEANYSDCDSGPYCDSCYDDEEHAIHDYSYKPEPIFYGNGPRYFGVELEIDGAGEDSYNAEQVLKFRMKCTLQRCQELQGAFHAKYSGSYSAEREGILCLSTERNLACNPCRYGTRARRGVD